MKTVEEIRSYVEQKIKHLSNNPDASIEMKDVLDFIEQKDNTNNFDDIWENENCSAILSEGENLSPKFKELFKEVCRAWYDKGLECASINKKDNCLPKNLNDAINLYYDTYGNGHWYFENLSFFKFKDIVETFVKEYGTCS